jgi:hypothetical protein
MRGRQRRRSRLLDASVKSQKPDRPRRSGPGVYDGRGVQPRGGAASGLWPTLPVLAAGGALRTFTLVRIGLVAAIVDAFVWTLFSTSPDDAAEIRLVWRGACQSDPQSSLQTVSVTVETGDSP